MLNSLLIYRLILLNGIALAGVAWAAMHGYVGMVFADEKTGIGYALIALFIYGLAMTAQRAWKVSRALNALKAGSVVDGSKFAIKQAFIGDIGVWLVTGGLIGNIVGFALAVQGLDLSGGTDAALAAIGQMLTGMKVAFYTTLIGTLLGLWTDVNARILGTATELFMKDAAQ